MFQKATWTNKSNIVTVTVFGNLYEEKNTADMSGEAPALLSILPPSPQVSESDSLLSTDSEYVIMYLCNFTLIVTFQDVWWVRISITTHY